MEKYLFYLINYWKEKEMIDFFLKELLSSFIYYKVENWMLWHDIV